jgi:hypothetical protein
MIRRGSLEYHEPSLIREDATRIGGDWIISSFNCVEGIHFARPDHAVEMQEVIARYQLDRLFPNTKRKSTQEEVAAEWKRIAAEREVILSWGRSTRMLQEAVQAYRFERRQGSWSYTAHIAASKVVEKADTSIADPMNYAGVLIEWAEREHRDWFWRCCRDQHVL